MLFDLSQNLPKDGSSNLTAGTAVEPCSRLSPDYVYFAFKDKWGKGRLPQRRVACPGSIWGLLFNCELRVSSDPHPWSSPKLQCSWTLLVQMPVSVPTDLTDPDHDLTPWLDLGPFSSPWTSLETAGLLADPGDHHWPALLTSFGGCGTGRGSVRPLPIQPGCHPRLPAPLPYEPVCPSLFFPSFFPACERRARCQLLIFLRAKVGFAYNTKKPVINSCRKCIS